MNWVNIDGKSYDVVVSSVEESFDILFSENTGRTLSNGARMFLDPIGTFYGHTVTFQRKNGFEEEYDKLFDYLSKPRRVGIPVEIVHNQTTISYDAYISRGTRALKRIDKNNGKVYWDKFTVNIIPMEAYLIAEDEDEQ